MSALQLFEVPSFSLLAHMNHEYDKKRFLSDSPNMTGSTEIEAWIRVSCLCFNHS